MISKTVLTVKGMTCSNCAQVITRHLQNKGLKKVEVHFESGEVELDIPENFTLPGIISDINSLGYKAIEKSADEKIVTPKGPSALEWKFLVSAFFTIPLLMHMFIDWPLLHNAGFQFLLCIPVVVIGVQHFGKSALGSLKAGVPNMDVLIATGSLMAFIYSTAGWILYNGTTEVHNYLFFETAATIISLVLLGNIIEQRSLKKTQSALVGLTKMQPQTANLIADGMTEKESFHEVDAQHLKENDLVLVNTGERIPADGQIYWGAATVDESSMTGESFPVVKSINDTVLAGTIITEGNVKFFVQKAGNETVLSAMIDLVKRASQHKPKIQRIGDNVSSKFVPVVIGIAIITFLISFFIADLSIQKSLLNSIAVLVISCPCAMGLATPTAVSVGIGRAAKNGILIKGGDVLERMIEIDTIVFDKTGTLTEGKLSIQKINFYKEQELTEYLLGTLEQYSTHPIAKTLTSIFSNSLAPYPIQFTEIKEEKGIGVKAIDKENNNYIIGSYLAAKNLTEEKNHQVYIIKNNEILATIDFDDKPRNGVTETIKYFKEKGITPVLLSGDNLERCERLAKDVGIDEIYSTKLPTEKTALIREWQKTKKVAMVGDGINDAPSLAEAWVGISMGSGTQIAIQSSDIVLLNHTDLTVLIKTHQLAAATIQTIKENLFWALIYNVIAIPVAAFGFLSPMIASFSMAFSDVVVIGNSLRLKIKHIFISK